MYGMVLMAAVAGTPDAAGFGKRDGGCSGVVAGCYGAPAGCDGGCSGRGGVFGLRPGGRKGSGCTGDAGVGCHGAAGAGSLGRSNLPPVVTIPFESTTAAAVPAPPPPEAAKKTLWDRLGGEKGVRAIVKEFVAAVIADPKVNFSRGGKYKLDEKAVERLEQLFLEQISSVSGGPFPYTGRAMKPVHAGMGITDAEFNAAAGHLVATLKKYNVPRADIIQLAAPLAATKPDIVEGEK